MALNSVSIEKTGGWYGFLNGLALIAYALILQITHLADVPILRFGFLVISVIFICMSISSLKQARGGMVRYLQGIAVGSVTSIVATVMFAFFTVINIQFFGSNIIEILQSENTMGEHLTLTSVFLVITMIGIPGGVLTSFIVMQYFKRPDHKFSQ
ncbi:hypothetical protein [Adhaeribacter soli]|uniref:DUF4199 domain-containing protein n=1 Tax=Adhaeribacter soli TaxID=2607655 RepID=A0A5N1IS60_9BACT|nr:hypothetical protein [Adhaeribacter soli]KAA9332850.1 hypothetical protein F0P94_12715 [Adhaeribacter soli]